MHRNNTIGIPFDLTQYTIEDRGLDTPCHIWQGPTNGLGYPRVRKGGSGRVASAHVASWERVNGPVPEGHDLHHECEVKLCINADHLKPMTEAEHNDIHHRGVRRSLQDTCRKGHPFDEANTYIGRNGYRYCRQCRRMYAHHYRDLKEIAGVKDAALT